MHSHHDPEENTKEKPDIDDDLDEPLGKPQSCDMDEGCESCQ